LQLAGSRRHFPICALAVALYLLSSKAFQSASGTLGDLGCSEFRIGDKPPMKQKPKARAWQKAWTYMAAAKIGFTARDGGQGLLV